MSESSEQDSQFDYPVKLGDGHVAVHSNDYNGDRFECESGSDTAYLHTGAWPTWDYCPFCGVKIDA